MERTFSPMVRQFSAIAGLQQAYTLVYSLDPDGETGCRLTLCRTGSSQRMDSKYMAVAPEFGYRVLQYLCENGVQPEIWQDVVAELDAAQQTEQEGGGRQMCCRSPLQAMTARSFGYRKTIWKNRTQCWPVPAF